MPPSAMPREARGIDVGVVVALVYELKRRTELGHEGAGLPQVACQLRKHLPEGLDGLGGILGHFLKPLARTSHGLGKRSPLRRLTHPLVYPQGLRLVAAVRPCHGTKVVQALEDAELLRVRIKL